MEKTISERHYTEADKRRWDFPVFKSAPPVLTKDTDNSISPVVTANGMHQNACFMCEV